MTLECLYKRYFMTSHLTRAASTPASSAHGNDGTTWARKMNKEEIERDRQKWPTKLQQRTKNSI